ncbi:MAG: hypothetical protein US95_C0049G0002 [Candidatus Woesebacteria bacterium GW2011_GWB1_38_5]|uniref:DUF5652 domain-containing protein n=3 Tax=Candidatus Woeseibacteriota TaxID=1752722 RepID=A0A0G0KDZ3_9BACT|nr:MAG: hypothetical protein US75_C0004G0017 [Candidatus Woesebacteria bacterium GW2011_GWC1_38_13]KKQ73695.1 MAG: hypothetical protein US95_C0049G0002 [Candidatus Woesebacteria bacterium GW2011_GWB1_38_5]KKQ84820.1 MAG: hypothetical protein UT06_C0001G0085 [Candidatus Woesebacteria bacterium GW2011_GWA1_38_8]
MTPDLDNIFTIIRSNPIFLLLYMAYNAVLKGLSLWRAAKNSHKYWFIGLLVVNLFGIPEILYLLYFSKKGGVQREVLQKNIVKSKVKKAK